MISIRLKLPLKHDHISIEAGTVISLPPQDAHKLVAAGIAEYAEPQRAVIEPQERRVRRK